ncbi:MAG: acetyl-CoA carboxylase biotin carboxyl carrier protein [Cyclobacteriaceae bacterium]|nr:acetyl-CoA carboxylase biotin carboxyl carrier protein [Cyclobacteriaceae bacterium SS2]
MKAKEIKELIDFISESGLEEVNIETSEVKLKVKRSQNVIAAGPVAMPQVAAAPAPAPTLPSPAEAAPKKAAESSDSNAIAIKSPMIGTFYKSPNPETAPFIKVGDVVKPGDTVCIIEAMKLFNEVESEVSGKIIKILVDDAEPVEFDQPLFLVDPS